MVTVAPRPDVDPDVKLPPAVAAAAARAEELQRQMTIQLQPDDPQPATNGDATPEPELPLEVTEPVHEPVAEESWEARYKSMKGRYDKEVPRLKEQIASLTSDANNLRNVLATLDARPRAEEAKPQPKPPKQLLTPEEVQDYGEEFFTVVEKKARELIEPLAEQYEERIKGLETQINGVGSQVVRTAVERMDAELDRDVPNWRAVNADWENNGFKEWLQLPDPYSGAIRHTLLNAAYERCDAPRVAAFFKGFHAEVAATSPAVDQPSRAVTTPKVPLASLAAPGRAKTAAQSLPAEKPYITRAQIQKYYDDVTAGRYKGLEQKRLEDEQAIFEAQRDGRIR